ncbi:hypothetical protein RFI_36126 [Reticulomyxa filosa]|uniref:Uncharacterized protein n=1 Tax=Reticulomyxa filosa TaxID=46433 RepID=X6LI69_RETFI|nr:hypothetical protein RFI_36126 [Reticulomyxa filosa]|eukprot:ETO01314.1 hypothetical protein RFI_36126 [Reticulomyxa filosa]
MYLVVLPDHKSKIAEKKKNIYISYIVSILRDIIILCDISTAAARLWIDREVKESKEDDVDVVMKRSYIEEKVFGRHTTLELKKKKKQFVDFIEFGYLEQLFQDIGMVLCGPIFGCPLMYFSDFDLVLCHWL